MCIASVGVVSDICRAMQKDFAKYFEGLMNRMYQALINPSVHMNVKPQIVAVMGDAALALGPGFTNVSFTNHNCNPLVLT